MHLISVSISSESILADIREIDNLVLIRIDLLINIINIIIHLIEISKR